MNFPRLTDQWTVTNTGGAELARVCAVSLESAQEKARCYQAVIESAAREGGFRVRRLRPDEVKETDMSGRAE